MLHTRTPSAGRRAWIIGALLLLLSAPLAAATLYVSPGGSDANDCLSPGTACATIAGAIGKSSDGDTIEVAAGTYTEANITVDKAVTIRGAGTASTFVEPGSIGFRPLADDVTIEDLTVRDGSQAVRFEDASGTIARTTLRNVHLTGNSSRGIEMHNSTHVEDLLIEDCLFEDGSVAIRSASSGSATGIDIIDSTFRGFTLGFYKASDGALEYVSDVTITGCTFEDNSFAAVYGEQISGFTVEDNTFTDNGRGFYLFNWDGNGGTGAEDLTIRGNTFTDHTAAAVEIWSDGDPSRNILVEGNAISVDVGVLAVNWASIDLRMGGDGPHENIAVLDNAVTLSGVFGGATAAHAVKLRGALPGDITLEGNVLDGGDVGGDGNTADPDNDVAGDPPTSGIYLVSDVSFYGPPGPDLDLLAQCNTISGFVQGISVYNAITGDYGTLATGASFAAIQNEISGNRDFGLRSGSGETVLAELNFWGSGDGPSGDGPGSGDAVVGNVDFTPFLVSPLTTCPSTILTIDVRPNNTRNQVNTNAKQLVPIAILGTADFDPCSEFDPEGVEVRTAIAVRSTCEDADGDGILDFLLKFRARDMTDPDADECADPDAVLVLEGATTLGEPVFGTDSVTWQGPSCD